MREREREEVRASWGCVQGRSRTCGGAGHAQVMAGRKEWGRLASKISSRFARPSASMCSFSLFSCLQLLSNKDGAVLQGDDQRVVRMVETCEGVVLIE
jgi:hypothetical protein